MEINLMGLSFRNRRSLWVFPIASLAFILLFLGPLGTKFELFDYQLGLLMLAVAFVLSALILIVELVILLKRFFAKESIKSNFDLHPIFLGLFVLLAIFSQLLSAVGAPAIHNISTNTTPAPSFDKALSLREILGSNPLEYRSNPKNAELQKQSYPELLPHASDLRAEELVRKVERILKEMEIEVINLDLENLRIEAVATSFWFGFEDDVLVQVRDYDNASIAEIRSVSRVGLSDLGKNASRIRKILAKLDQNKI